MIGFLAITAKELWKWFVVGAAIGAGFEVGRKIVKAKLQDKEVEDNLTEFLVAGAPMVIDNTELRELRKLFKATPKAH